MSTPSRDPNASWFGRFDPSESDDWPDPVDLPWQTTQADPAAGLSRRPDSHSFLRTYRTFLSSRALLGVVLLALLAGNWFMGNRALIWIVTAVAYACLAVLLWAWPSTMPHQRASSPQAPPTLSPRQALLSIGLDLAFFSLLQHLMNTTLNTQALLALPVLMAGVMMPRLVALAVAAVASINLLAAAWIQGTLTSNLSAQLTEAGLTGFGLFAIAALASELAARVAREERSARGSMELARQQAQLNRLVMEEMSEGVIVVDRHGRVRTANPAARRLLSAQGLAPPAPFQLRGMPAWAGLVLAVEQAVTAPLQAESGQEVLLRFDDGTRRELRVRVRFTRGNKALHAEDMCMLWLEDLRIVRARQRQDKLAAMGRMSAGIAHEIRNPLAAISQANALLEEDASNPAQKRLMRMVSDNVVRLQHIVDDILAVAPGARPPTPAIDPIEAVQAICVEWRLTHGLSDDSADALLRVHLPAPPPSMPRPRVRFEVEHLQRVLVNLLDNALRHCSGQPGAVEVTLSWRPARQSGAMLLLSIGSDGEPLSVDTERSLFEPFFSTRSRGTGLGLYICKELCERHGAAIDYRQHPPAVRHRNEFFVTMPIEPDGVSPYLA